MAISSHAFTKLRARQKKYLEGLAMGKTRQQALDYAGYSETTRPCRVENSSVKAAFTKLMQRAAPAHKVAARIAEGLDATETKFFQKDGIVTDQKDVINWSERRAYAELAAEYGGYKETEKQPLANIGVQVTVEHIGNQDPVATEAVATVEVIG